MYQAGQACATLSVFRIVRARMVTTVDMKEWQERQNIVAFAIWAAIPRYIPSFTSLQHHNIRDNILMAQHDSFWVACRSWRIYQKCKIGLRIRFRPSIPARPSKIPYHWEVLELVGLVPLIAHQDDSLLGYPSLFCSLQCNVKERFLGAQCLRAWVFQLESQFVCRISWVRWRNNAAGPVCTPYYRWCVNAVGCEKCQYVSFLPFPDRFKTFAKVYGGVFDLGIGVWSGGVGVSIDY